MRKRVRFGLFEFDLDTRELRREGSPVRLQAQPAQVLAVLVGCAGEVVTREELRQAVWGSDTFVDFDRGLNYCIAQIRSALGDSAESPRYIRTIPKRGYEFLAPIGQSAPPPARRTWKPIAAAAVVLAIGLAAGLMLYARARPVNIAVARFDNETGDEEMTRFADALTDAVVADLTAGGGNRYRIIGNAALLRRPRAERDLSAIGSELHAGYVVLGQVQRGPKRVRVLAHLIRLPDQTHVAAARYDRDGDPGAIEGEVPGKIVAEFFARLAAPNR